MENTRQRYPGCKLPQPYPAVPHPKQDARTARKLMPLLLGRTGALSRYIALSYAAAALGQTVPMLAQTLECLAQTEQMHMSLLLELLGQLDATPRHVVVSATPFTTLASFSNPIKQIEALRSLAIAARKQYEKEATEYAAASPAISQLLSRLAQDEQHHAALLYHLPKRLG